MAFFRVEKEFSYKETVYIEADDHDEAERIANLHQHVSVENGSFQSVATEVTFEEFEEMGEWSKS